MRIALDTNRYTDLSRGDSEVGQHIRLAHAIYMPFIVLGELRGGFLRGSRPQQNEALLMRFLSTPRVQVLYADEQTTHQYARLVEQLRGQGTPIPINDMWIAALVLQHGLTLYTRDRHFDQLPQIPRL